MSALPAIDIVVLSWNRLESTLETIANVQEQVGVRPKVWVVDQGSEEQFLKVFRELAARDKISLLELGRNLGIPAGKNEGMALGSAEFIVSIDNDAVFERDDALLHIVRRFEQDPKLGAIGFRIKNYYTGLDDRLSWSYPRYLLQKIDDEFLATRYCGVGHALRRSALASTKGYDESLFAYWEELDLAYQLIAAGYKILYDPGVVVLHKVSPEQRLDWRGKRYYYLVRNAIYLNYKYFRSPLHILLLAIGYLVKGIYNGVLRQTVLAARDALEMISKLQQDSVIPLNKEALKYIWENDLRYRGSIWQRIHQEVFEHLP